MIQMVVLANSHKSIQVLTKAIEIIMRLWNDPINSIEFEFGN